MQASLFVTCLVDLFRPDVAEAAVRVLERQGVEVEFPAEQTCCGQAHFNAGFREEAEQLALHFLDVFAGSQWIVTPSGSCAAMVKQYYPGLLAHRPHDRERAEDVGGRLWEFCGFLCHVLQQPDVGAAFPVRAAYHASCHLARELGAGGDPRAVLGEVRGLEVVEIPQGEQCCGFGGAFSLTMSDISTAMGDAKLANFGRTGCDVLVGADAGCLLHLEGRLRRQGSAARVLHVAEVLAAGLEGREGSALSGGGEAGAWGGGRSGGAQSGH